MSQPVLVGAVVAAADPVAMPGIVRVMVVVVASATVDTKAYVNDALACADAVAVNVRTLVVSAGAVMAGDVAITDAGVAHVELDVVAAVLAGELAARGPGGAEIPEVSLMLHVLAAANVAVAAVNVTAAFAAPLFATAVVKVVVPHPV